MNMITVIVLLFFLSVPVVGFSATYDEMKDAAFEELDMATGECDTALATQTRNVEKLKTIVLKRNKKIVALNVDVKKLQSQLNARGNTQACDTATLNQTIAALKLENSQLKTKLVKLQESKSSSVVAGDSSAVGGKENNLLVNQVSASTVFNKNKKFQASNLTDGDPGTFWRSGNKKSSGQIVKLSFKQNKMVSRIYISVPEYNHGHPPESLTFYFSDGSTQRVKMENKWGKQRFSIKPILTKTVEIEIGDSYTAGKKKTPYVQIAEFELFGG